MSHSGDASITDCLPTIDQLNNAVRSIVRPVPSSTSEPRVQRKHQEKKKIVAKPIKEPPKYADVVLPIPNIKHMTEGLSDTQAAQALSIEGSFTPIQPKLSDTPPLQPGSLSAPAQSLMCPVGATSGDQVSIHTLRLPVISHKVAHGDAGADSRILPVQILHSSPAMPPCDTRMTSTGEVTSETVVASLFSQGSIHPCPPTAAPVLSATANQTFTQTLHGGHHSCGEMGLYTPTDHLRHEQGDSADLGAGTEEAHPGREHEQDPYKAGPELCVSPPTVPASVLEALSLKEGTHLFPTLQQHSGIHILSLEGFLGQGGGGHVGSAPYRATPSPSSQTAGGVYGESSAAAISYHPRGYDAPDASIKDERKDKHRHLVPTECQLSGVMHQLEASSFAASPLNVKDIDSGEGSRMSSLGEKDGAISEDVMDLLLSKNQQGQVLQVESSSDVNLTYHEDVTQDDGAPLTEGKYCLECNQMYPEHKPCAQHACAYLEMADSPVPTRAVATLPKQLSYVVDDSENPNANRVVAQQAILKGTLFGPLDGVIQTETNLTDANYRVKRYTWPLFEDGKPVYQLDCQSEDFSNWLMFLRPAHHNAARTVTMYQNGLKIYYITARDVEPGEELAYWYSADYAKLLDCGAQPEEMFSCSQCKRHFPNSTMLQRHATRQHPDNTKKKFSCHICEKAFSTSTKLSIHQRCHRGDRPFSCQQCNKRFADRSNLNKHLKIHSGERPHTCMACGKSFRQKAHLESHVVTHTGYKPFRCAFCERSYSRQSDLNIHVRSHTKSKQFLCAHCPKTFHKLQNFQKHQLTHTGERSHACALCGRGFGQKYHRKRHEETCKGEKPKKVELNAQTGAELGLSIAKKRIQKRDRAEQAAKAKRKETK